MGLSALSKIKTFFKRAAHRKDEFRGIGEHPKMEKCLVHAGVDWAFFGFVRTKTLLAGMKLDGFPL